MLANLTVAPIGPGLAEVCNLGACRARTDL